MRILYYPTISIPDSEWLRRTLLYSEGVASIVPFQYAYRLDSDPLMYELKQSGFYRALEPFDIADRESFKREAKRLVNRWSRRRKTNLKQHLNDGKTIKMSVYHQKLFPELMGELDKNNLIIRNEPESISIEYCFGIAYLKLLASYMAAENDYIPGTDKRTHQSRYYPYTRHDKAQLVGALSLVEALPAPSKEVQIGDIIEFKTYRQQEFKRFVDYIESMERELSNSTPEDIPDLLQRHTRNIGEEIAYLRSLFDISKIKYTPFSLDSLIEIVTEIAPIAGGIIMAAGPQISLDPRQVATGAGLYFAVDMLKYGIRRIRNYSKFVKAANSSSLSYVFYAEKKFGY